MSICTKSDHGINKYWHRSSLMLSTYIICFILLCLNWYIIVDTNYTSSFDLRN